MSPNNGSGITSQTIPARVCCPKGPAWCKGSIPTYKLVFDKSDGRTPECECCGADYRIPPNIPKDLKKVPRPTRAKTPSRTPTRSPTRVGYIARHKKISTTSFFSRESSNVCPASTTCELASYWIESIRGRQFTIKTAPETKECRSTSSTATSAAVV